MPEIKPKKILIAEDEKAYARALVLKLQNAGFEAESVSNGAEALEAIQHGHYDLLVCDLIMPKTNGFEVLETIQKEKMGLRVIVMSNLTQEADEQKARKLGAKDFFAKSNITIADAVSKIEQSLRS